MNGTTKGSPDVYGYGVFIMLPLWVISLHILVLIMLYILRRWVWFRL